MLAASCSISFLSFIFIKHDQRGPMKPRLDKSDLILFESVLKDSLNAVISFSAYSLYFPQEIPSTMYQGREIVPVVEKDRVLLPLVHDGRFLGIFMARGTDPERMQALSLDLPGIISLCLDKVLLQKQCITDSITGLYNQEKFHQMLEKAVEDIQASLTLGPAASMDSGLDRYSATFCVMLINPDRFKRINETFGFPSATRFFMNWLIISERNCPNRPFQPGFATIPWLCSGPRPRQPGAGSWPRTLEARSLPWSLNTRFPEKSFP